MPSRRATTRGATSASAPTSAPGSAHRTRRSRATDRPRASSTTSATRVGASADTTQSAPETQDEFVTPPQPIISLPPSVRRNIFQQQMSRRENRHIAPSAHKDEELSSPQAYALSGMRGAKKRLSSVIEEGDSSIVSTPDTMKRNRGLPAPGDSATVTNFLTPTTRPRIPMLTSSEDEELVSRDVSGKYNVPVDPLVGADGDMSASIDALQAEAMMHIMSDKEGIEIEIAEMMRQYRNRKLSDERLRLYDLVKQSLQERVASVDEDDWMYCVEGEIHP